MKKSRRKCRCTGPNSLAGLTFFFFFHQWTAESLHITDIFASIFSCFPVLAYSANRESLPFSLWKHNRARPRTSSAMKDQSSRDSCFNWTLSSNHRQAYNISTTYFIPLPHVTRLVEAVIKRDSSFPPYCGFDLHRFPLQGLFAFAFVCLMIRIESI